MGPEKKFEAILRQKDLIFFISEYFKFGLLVLDLDADPD
jgi:hypothetical protein